MTARAGVLRNAAGLAEAGVLLDKLASTPAEVVGVEAWETTNLVTISAALAAAAELREETRGSHWRDDFPARDDERWAGHLDVTMDDGALALGFVPAPATDGAARVTEALLAELVDCRARPGAGARR